MSVRIKLKGWDIVVLPFEGKVLGKLRRDDTRKEIFTSINKTSGYHMGNATRYPYAYRAQLIWFAANGPIPKGMHINHINHNRTDDKITNLELVTRLQNNIYKQKQKNNTTGFTGVSYDKNTKKYKSKIQVGGVTFHLGSYTKAEEAARVYDNIAREWAGRYAILNFSDTDKEVS